jgi:hypothetical protein
MSPDMKRFDHAGEAAHERARMLAAESIDAELETQDAEWLAGHLASCPDCAAVAEEYRALHLELRELATPETPRDLWARTSAAFDRIDGVEAGHAASGSRGGRAGRRPLVSTALAVGVVVAVAVVSLLVQSPIVAPAPRSTNGAVVAIATASPGRSSGTAQAPLTVVNGTSYWIASSGGVYEIKGGTAQCGVADGSCTVPDGGQTLGSVSSDSTVSAVIAPGADEAAVWTDQKIVILPLAEQPQTVSIDLLTPRPTAVATATPVGTSTAAPTPTAATEATPTATESPISGPSATEPTSTIAPTETPLPTTTPAASPTAAAATTTTTTTEATAILSGYEIVGPDPEFSPDGSLVAFSARPVDNSTGPDVFVWRSGDQQATPITSLHSDLFAGWSGGQVLFSEISAAGESPTASGTGGSDTVGATSFVFDPSTGTYRKIDLPMLLPAVDPTGRFLVYWAGTVEFDPVSGLWQPGKGDLYFDTWSDIALDPASSTPVSAATPTQPPAASASPATEASGSPESSLSIEPTAADTAAAESSLELSPTATVAAPSSSPAVQQALPQLLPVSSAPGAVQTWVVRWDSLGQNVAVWVADPGSTDIGRLSLFSIGQTSAQVGTGPALDKLLSADKVLASVAFDDAHLVYTSAVDGKTYLQAVPEVRPSTASTPTPTTPGQVPSDAAAAGSAAPQATDRPGN